MNIISKIANRIAMDFPTEEALKKYLEDHPDADKSLHKVVKKRNDVSFEDLDDRVNTVVRRCYSRYDKEMEAILNSKVDIYTEEFKLRKQIERLFLYSLYDARKSMENSVHSDKKGFSLFKEEMKSFTHSGYKDCAGKYLSVAVMKVFGGKEPDYRQKSDCFAGFALKGTDTKTLVDVIKIQMKIEQELLRKAGLVDDDGNVTVYRGYWNVRHEDVFSNKYRLKGNYIDSWSLNPKVANDFASGRSALKKGFVIKAKIPVEKVIASCLGNQAYESNIQEQEITFNSKEIDNCEVFKFAKPKDYLKSTEDYYRYLEQSLARRRKISFVSNKKQQFKDIQEPTDKDLEKIKEVLKKAGKEIPSKDKLIVIFKSMIQSKGE